MELQLFASSSMLYWPHFTTLIIEHCIGYSLVIDSAKWRCSAVKSHRRLGDGPLQLSDECVVRDLAMGLRYSANSIAEARAQIEAVIAGP